MCKVGWLEMILHVALYITRVRRRSVSSTDESALSWLAYFGISIHFKVAVGTVIFLMLQVI